MVDYGSGPGLDKFLDLVVGPSGDLASSSGVDELRKDLSYQLIGALRYGHGVDRPASLTDGVVGEPIGDGLSEDISIVVSDIIEDDQRVESVPEIRVNQVELEKITIGARIVLVNDETIFESFIIDA
jgi:hypothetical protein